MNLVNSGADFVAAGVEFGGQLAGVAADLVLALIPMGILMGMVFYANGWWTMPDAQAAPAAREMPVDRAPRQIRPEPKAKANAAARPSRSRAPAPRPPRAESAEGGYDSSGDDLWFARRDGQAGDARRVVEEARRVSASSGSNGPASQASSWQADFELRQRDPAAWERRWSDRYELDFTGDATSRGVQVDELRYEDLRVPGLVAENIRRRGPQARSRAPLLEQIAQDVAAGRGRRMGVPSDVNWAFMPRPARRPVSAGASADLRDFREMRMEALARECHIRGLSVVGLRHVLLRRVLDDVEENERSAARRS